MSSSSRYRNWVSLLTGSISRFCEHRYRLLRLDQAAGLINLTTVLALARQRLAGTNPGAKILIVPAASTARPLRPVIDPPKDTQRPRFFLKADWGRPKSANSCWPSHRKPKD